MTTPQSLTTRLAADGAVLQIWNSPARFFLVGEINWIDSHRLFWFTAHGDREDDGHLLEFDTAQIVDTHAVEFLRSGRRVGILTDIARAHVDDPEDYTVAFALWQQVAPRTQTLVRRSRARYEAA